MTPRAPAPGGDPADAAWSKEIDLALPFTSQFVVSGNIHDLQRVPTGRGEPAYVGTVDLLMDRLAGWGYDLVYRYDPVDGITLARRHPDVDGGELFSESHLGRATTATPGRLADLIKLATGQDRLGVAVLVDFAGHFWREEATAPAEVRSLLNTSQRLTRSPAAGVHHDDRGVPVLNAVFWLVDDASSAPAWLVRADSTRVISVPVPQLGARRRVAQDLAPRLPGYDRLDVAQRAAVVDALAESTQGMTARRMRSVATLALDQGIAAEHVDEAVRSYRAGVLESPWQDPALLDRIGRAEGIVSNRVLGQDHAVARSLDVLLRSAMGLTGAQARSRSGRPQGVLFFAGPTGVGKTELAKALAEVLFGAEDAYTRFDMSEFSAEHSEARLIGAPPGYVGHGSGGELTNAVRQKPFSILLFDEIEKAHPRILDKFLQILEDGRLTDGSGDTAYFSETVIIFTSNLGTAQLDDHGKAAGAEATILATIQKHFITELQRPELLNRIGDNIIVFAPITGDVGRRLVGRHLRSIVDLLHRRRGCELVIDPAVARQVETEALRNLAFGGRGISSAVESTFVNPLARALFDLGASTGPVVARDLRRADRGWELFLQATPPPAHGREQVQLAGGQARPSDRG